MLVKLRSTKAADKRTVNRLMEHSVFDLVREEEVQLSRVRGPAIAVRCKCIEHEHNPWFGWLQKNFVKIEEVTC